jgi:hypothetical protein
VDQFPTGDLDQFPSGASNLAVEHIRTRYDVGLLVHCVRYSDDSHEMQTLKRILHLDPSALRRHARVAETIDGTELGTLLALRTARGMPLPWSCLEILTGVRSRVRRERLAVAAIRNGLSARDLTTLARDDA